MRAVVGRIVGAIFALSLAGCMADDTDVAGVSGRDPSPTDFIKLEKGPCFGACPVFELTLFGDGRALFYGTRFTKEKGQVSDVYSVARFLEVLDALNARNFDSFADSYDMDNCPVMASDHPVVTISLHSGGDQKTVLWNTGCRGFAERPELERLESELDRILDIERFIGTPEERKPPRR